MALFIFLGAVAVGVYFRRRAEKSQTASDQISIREEGPVIMIGLRLAGLFAWASILVYLIHPEWMSWSQISLPAWIRWLGVGLGVIAVPLLYWLLSSIGTNITQTVGVKQDHQLITHGPYRWIRHPLYSVGTLFFSAFALMAANWFILLWTGAAFLFLRLRLPQEEEKLIEKFGDDYRAYKRRTGRFLPRLTRGE